LDDKSRNIMAGAAIGACLGAFAGWMISRREGGEGSPVEVNKGRALALLWAVVGVVRLIMGLDTE
jgi:hypothetical protein